MTTKSFTMLLKSNISDIVIHSDAWFQGRLAKFTSSEWHFLMSEKGIDKTGLNYIYRKVGEELTGLPCRKEVSTEATEHGHIYEPEGIRAFGLKMGIEFLVTQKLITNTDKRQGSTPDAIWVHNESTDKLSYNVSTLEQKCPPTYDNYIKLWKCKTPADVKKVEPKYYWQVIHQMMVCDCLKGYFSVFHPFFKVGQLNIVEFRKIELATEFKLAAERGRQAMQLFEETRNEMMAA